MEFIQHDAAFGWRSKSAPHVSVRGQIKHSLSVNKLDVGGLLCLLLAPFVVEVPHLCGWQAAATIHVEQIARVKCIYPQDLYATLTVVLLTPRLFYKKKPQTLWTALWNLTNLMMNSLLGRFPAEIFWATPIKFGCDRKLIGTLTSSTTSLRMES